MPKMPCHCIEVPLDHVTLSCSSATKKSMREMLEDRFLRDLNMLKTKMYLGVCSVVIFYITAHNMLCLQDVTRYLFYDVTD
jgi:hypothetical protein